MRVFTTGATGLLGNTIVRQLSELKHDPVALVRSPPDPHVFDDTNVEIVESQLIVNSAANDDAGTSEDGRSGADIEATQGSESISDVDLIDSAVAESDAVIHCAGLIHLGWTRMEESMKVNRDGTQRIVDACLRHNKRLIYIGTLNSIAVGTREHVANELTPLANAGGQIKSAYVLSKRAGLDVVKQASAKGLDSVIIHPGFMLGPWDWKPSSGQMMLELSRGWKMISPSGGCSVCDSRDVASTTIRAIEFDGPPGREFILAGANWTYKKLWTEMARRFDRRTPIMPAGPGQRFIAGLFGDLVTKLTGREPLLNSASMAMSSQFHWYSSDRAREELDYESRDPHKTLDDAADWIRERFHT